MTDLTPAELVDRLQRAFSHPYLDDQRAAIAMIKQQSAEIEDIRRHWNATLDALGKASERIDRAESERDRLRAALGRVEQLRTRMTEHAEPHVPGCEGQPDCAGCIYLDLDHALAGNDNGGEA